jgi:hypothetical protein
MIMRRLSLSFAAAVALIWTATPQSLAAPGDTDAFRAGTDLGALYLSEHIQRMRVMLFLQECGEDDMADAVSAELPNSVDYTLQKLSDSALSKAEAESAAQIARAYLLGYEIGVRAEFRAEKDKAQVTRRCDFARDLAVRKFGAGG